MRDARGLGVEMEASRQLLHRADPDKEEIAVELVLTVRVDAEGFNQIGTGARRMVAQQAADRWAAIHTVAWRLSLGENVELLAWDCNMRQVSGHMEAQTTPVYACALHYAGKREQAGTAPNSCAEEYGPPTEWKKGGRETARAASGMGVNAVEVQEKETGEGLTGEGGGERRRRASEWDSSGSENWHWRRVGAKTGRGENWHIHLLPEGWPEKRGGAGRNKEGEKRPAQISINQKGGVGANRGAFEESLSSAPPAGGDGSQ